MPDQIVPVLLTYNEEQNISRTLSHLAWAKDIVVVDSGSTDGIRAALAHFPNARMFSSGAASIAWACELASRRPSCALRHVGVGAVHGWACGRG